MVIRHSVDGKKNFFQRSVEFENSVKIYYN